MSIGKSENLITNARSDYDYINITKSMSASSNLQCNEPQSNINLFALYDELKELCRNNVEFYCDDETSKGQRLYGAFVGLIDHIDTVKLLILDINEFVDEFDFEKKTPGNGYRSFIYVTDCAIKHGIKLSRYVVENRSSLLFRKGIYMK